MRNVSDAKNCDARVAITELGPSLPSSIPQPTLAREPHFNLTFLRHSLLPSRNSSFTAFRYGEPSHGKTTTDRGTHQF